MKKQEKVHYELRLADSLRPFFTEETGKFNEEFLSMKIKDIILVDKELDKPLPWYKSITAKLINFTTNHEFLIFKIAESDIVGSIDFYNDNRLVFRLGNNQTLVQGDKTGKRNSFSLVPTPLNKPFLSEEQNSLNLGELLQIAYKFIPKDGYGQLKYNCSHYSRDVLKETQKTRKQRQYKVKESKFISTITFDLE